MTFITEFRRTPRGVRSFDPGWCRRSRPGWEANQEPTRPPTTASGSTLGLAADGLGVPATGVSFVTLASHCPGLPPESWTPPASRANRHPMPSYGFAIMFLWGDPGVSPMWIAAHGSLTVTTLGRHQGGTSTARRRDGDGWRPWKDRFLLGRQRWEPSLSKKWTQS